MAFFLEKCSFEKKPLTNGSVLTMFRPDFLFSSHILSCYHGYGSKPNLGSVVFFHNRAKEKQQRAGEQNDGYFGLKPPICVISISFSTSDKGETMETSLTDRKTTFSCKSLIKCWGESDLTWHRNEDSSD